MCGLCSVDQQERNSERDALAAKADRIEELAVMLRQMSRGHIKPHSDSGISPLARSIIRYLVDEWM